MKRFIKITKNSLGIEKNCNDIALFEYCLKAGEIYELHSVYNFYGNSAEDIFWNTEHPTVRVTIGGNPTISVVLEVPPGVYKLCPMDSAEPYYYDILNREAIRNITLAESLERGRYLYLNPDEQTRLIKRLSDIYFECSDFVSLFWSTS